jgi:hypothetical protein
MASQRVESSRRQIHRGLGASGANRTAEVQARGVCRCDSEPPSGPRSTTRLERPEENSEHPQTVVPQGRAPKRPSLAKDRTCACDSLAAGHLRGLRGAHGGAERQAGVLGEVPGAHEAGEGSLMR